MSRLIFLVLLTSLAACSPAPLSMPYAPTGMVLPDTTHRQTIRVEQATDERREGDRTWFGAIRGGYGNPLKVMHADMPIAEVVGRAFNSALDARGLLAGPSIAPRLALTVTVHEFEVSHMVRRDANMDFSINLTDRSTGRTIWHDRHAVHRVDNRVGLDMGILASPDDLRAFALRAMSEAVDAMLDKPDFRAALR